MINPAKLRGLQSRGGVEIEVLFPAEPRTAAPPRFHQNKIHRHPWVMVDRTKALWLKARIFQGNKLHSRSGRNTRQNRPPHRVAQPAAAHKSSRVQVPSPRASFSP